MSLPSASAVRKRWDKKKKLRTRWRYDEKHDKQCYMRGRGRLTVLARGRASEHDREVQDAGKEQSRDGGGEKEIEKLIWV